MLKGEKLLKQKQKNKNKLIDLFKSCVTENVTWLFC